ncbi:MAG: phage terminase large subunit family protein [Eubacterium sp.]|nr:phage terminase large subunit family protein [Eubacterium sp.]
MIKRTLIPPEQMSVSQWAEKYRVLDETSNISGRWSNSITPYLVGIMDTYLDPWVREIYFCKATQVGGTEALINLLCYILMMEPSPTMIVYPTKELAKDISNGKLKPAFRLIPEIKKIFLEGKSKQLLLKFKRMSIYLRSAETPAQLASVAIKYLFFDEIDKMGGASQKEASPYNLAKERTKTYHSQSKIYACSTPTLKTNYIWRLHEDADEVRHYFVPCPHCGEMIELKWKQVIFEKDENRELSPYERAQSAVYICQECGCIIHNSDKPQMLLKGEWRAVKKRGNGKPKTVGFWINSLYSVFVTWELIAEEFLKTRDDPDEYQNFINSWLAEPWEDTRLKTSADLVLDRQTGLEPYMLPEWTKLLTGGVDVQETCFYWTLRAWGNFSTSQNIAHGQALSFREIERIMNLKYKMADGTEMIVNLALIDSGDQTDMVYDFCTDNSDWALPCKGASNSMQSHYRISKVNKSDSKAYGMDLVLVDGGKYKDMIAARMHRANGEGSWMVHKDCDTEYAEQVTAEHKVNVRLGNGKKKLAWTMKTSHADNHYLDAEVYAYAAADILGVRTLHMEELEESEREEAKPQPQEDGYRPEEEWIRQNEDWLKE